MATAYVLINCELGSEEAVIAELKSIEDVKEVHGTFGAYDILAKVESGLVETLRETITWKIRKIPKIRSTFFLKGITSIIFHPLLYLNCNDVIPFKNMSSKRITTWEK